MAKTEELGFTRAYWLENVVRSFRDWESRDSLVGFLVLVVGIFGYGWVFDKPEVAGWALYLAGAYLGLMLFVITPWRMWDDSKREIGGFRERLKPRISFVFDPASVPYLQHFPLTVDRLVYKVRMYRVGLRNDSAAPIKRARVVVESVDFLIDGVLNPPSTDNPVPVEHALNIMGMDRKDGFVTIAPGDRPTAYVDFIEQWIQNNNPSKHFSLCYAVKVRAPLQLLPSWVIGIRAEGAGTYARAKFVVTADASNQITVTPYSLL
jgi:hypothetical protein